MQKNNRAYLTAVFCLVMILESALIGVVLAQDSVVVKKKNELVAAAKETISTISVPELSELISNGTEFHLIDVRTHPEFMQGHIKSARWVARGTLEFEAAKGKLGPLDALYVVYCKKDPRGALSAQTLQVLGYTNVKNLSGGFEAWADSGNSIYNMHGELKVVSFEKKEVE